MEFHPDINKTSDEKVAEMLNKKDLPKHEVSFASEEEHKEAAGKGTFNPFGGKKLEEAEDEKEEKKGDETEGGGEGGFEFGTGGPILLGSAVFETGTVKYKPGAREKAKEAIKKSIEEALAEKAKPGNQKKIVKYVVEGRSSKQRQPDKDPKLAFAKNLQLAQDRAAEGEVLVREVVSKYFNGQEILIETHILNDADVFDNVSEEEKAEMEELIHSNPKEFDKKYDSLIDANESIKIEALVAENPGDLEVEFLPQTKPKVEHGGGLDIKLRPLKVVNLSTTYAFLADNSASMNTEREKMLKDIAEENAIRKGEDVKVFRIKNEHAGGGDQIEQHVETILKAANEMPAQANGMDIVIFTDEPQEDEGHGMGVRETKRKMKEALEIINKKGGRIVGVFFNPDESVGGQKEVVLNESNVDKFLTMPSGDGGRAERKIAWYNSL